MLRRHPLKQLSSALTHPLSYAGAILALLSAVLTITLIVLDLLGLHSNPYIGVLTYLVLPAGLVLGLILIPLGSLRARRKESRGETETYPVLDLNVPRQRRRLLFFGASTLVIVVIFSAVAYRGVEFMDSVTFCGLTCHKVMKPEYTAYGYSPHARVRCVDCHIGPGADWYVRAKLSGVRQVFAALFDTYQTPIPTPVENLRPARETCEECHWPKKFHGDRIRVRTHHLEDESSTPTSTVLVLKVGGGGSEGREATGIHWHVNPANRVRYIGNEDRSEIYWVEVAGPGGETREYRKAGHEMPAVEMDGPEIRTLDCMDCHNRPTHNFETPEDAVDRVLATGIIDRSLPYIRREALRVLRTEIPAGEAAGQAFPESLRAFYVREYPDLAAARADDIRSAGTALAEVWSRSVFPEMKVTWATYPEHIGHRNFPGCFRCHDEEHATGDGETISQACDTCHTLLAVDEESPEILQQVFPR